MKYDLIIIGGGPGGYTAAFSAAAAKLKVCVIEERELGGTCLNRGCIPTKTLVHTADLYREMCNPELTAVKAESLHADIALLNAKKERIVSQLRSGIEKAMKSGKIDVIYGHGRIEDANHVTVNDEVHEADHIIVATGSVPFRLPVEGADLEGVITSDDILKDIPQFENLVIIGGGVIGCEIAGIYEALGTKVTILEALDYLVANLDSECGRSLAMVMKKRGTEVHCKATVKKIEKAENGLSVFFEEKGELKQVNAEAVLLAAGRKAVTDVFACEPPETNRGRFVINENCQTSIANIYAIGDAAYGYPQLAHTAMAMGENAVAAILNEKPKKNMSCIVSGVYTSPEIGAAGITEKEAAEKGIDAVSGKANTLSNARSLIASDERGFIKITAEKGSGKILGAVFMCERATDLVQEAANAIALGQTVNELLSVIHGHPTFSEGFVSALEAVSRKI